ncbi:MAG: glycosyltransferase family 2 protein [Planctomycetaceae bacterium]|jgi:hypothetical protein|nr:glycosyltransferase family 2 protein [Planctomycetaceae bacterium]
MGKRKQVYLTLGAIVRNQAHYIKEWLGFYYLMGVERFCIALHHCTDETEQRIKELPFQKQIELFTIRGDSQHVQMGTYKKLHEMYGSSTKWMLFIDSDEFMFPLKVNSLSELLQRYEKCSSLSVSQRMFGHSGLVLRPDGLSIESFIWATHPENDGNDRAIKSIYQPKYLHAFYSPHFQICHTLPQVLPNKKTFKLENHCLLETMPMQDIVRYNHYFTRSMEDWIARYNRGSCNDKRQSSASYDASEFHRLGVGYMINEDILKYAIPLRKLLGLPYHDIQPNNVKTVTWATGIYGERIAKTAILSGKQKKIKVVPVISDPVFFRSSIYTKLLAFRRYIKDERKKGTKYLLCVDGRDTLFLDDMKTICHKLQLLYDNKVICCSQSFSFPYREDTFNFLVGSKYSWYGFANPCAFFGATKDLDILFDRLVAVYYRLKNNKPETQVEKHLLDIKIDPAYFDNVQFIWQVYQANGQYWDLQPDTDVRLFSQVENIAGLDLKNRKHQPRNNNSSYLGNSCIVHVPADAERDDFNQWAIAQGLLYDERIGNGHVDVPVDKSVLRTTAGRKHKQKPKR